MVVEGYLPFRGLLQVLFVVELNWEWVFTEIVMIRRGALKGKIVVYVWFSVVFIGVFVVGKVVACFAKLLISLSICSAWILFLRITRQICMFHCRRRCLLFEHFVSLERREFLKLFRCAFVFIFIFVVIKMWND
jgi:hypothetical protein